MSWRCAFQPKLLKTPYTVVEHDVFVQYKCAQQFVCMTTFSVAWRTLNKEWQKGIEKKMRIQKMKKHRLSNINSYTTAKKKNAISNTWHCQLSAENLFCKDCIVAIETAIKNGLTKRRSNEMESIKIFAHCSIIFGSLIERVTTNPCQILIKNWFPINHTSLILRFVERHAWYKS